VKSDRHRVGLTLRIGGWTAAATAAKIGCKAVTREKKKRSITAAILIAIVISIVVAVVITILVAVLVPVTIAILLIDPGHGQGAECDSKKNCDYRRNARRPTLPKSFAALTLQTSS
jgi:hypothetical protein